MTSGVHLARMDNPMESNKYLWQPRPNGPIHIRVSYADANGKRCHLCRSLRTSHWPSARRIRDAEFMPLILDVNKAKAQLELIGELYPHLVDQLQKGVHGGWGPDTEGGGHTLQDLVEQWGKAIAAERGNTDRHLSVPQPQAPMRLTPIEAIATRQPCWTFSAKHRKRRRPSAIGPRKLRAPRQTLPRTASTTTVL